MVRNNWQPGKTGNIIHNDKTWQCMGKLNSKVMCKLVNRDSSNGGISS